MDEHIDYITTTASFEIHAGGDKTCPINSISINWYESLFAFSMSSEPALFILWTDERDNNPFFVVLCAPEKMTIAVKYVFAFERLPKLKKRKRCHRGHSRTKIQLKPVRERFACDHWKEIEGETERSLVMMGHGGWEMEEEKCNLHLNNNDYCYVQGNCNTLRLPYGR